MMEEQDKKLADKGWQSMRQLLDRELPEERKKRPFAWWWLGLLLLPLAILGSRAWRQTPYNPDLPAQTASKNERPVVQNGKKSPQTAGEKPTPGKTIAADWSASGPIAQAPPMPQQLRARSGTQKSLQIPDTRTPGSPTAPTSAPRTTALTTTPQAEQDLAILAPTTPSSASRTTAAAPEPTPTTTLQAEQDIAILSETTPPSSSQSGSGAEYAAFLNTLMLPLLAVHPEKSPFQPRSFDTPAAISVKPAKKDARWALGVSLAASTERFSTVNGLSAGLSTDWRFARKWGLRTGLSYTRYQPSNSQQPVVVVEQAKYSDATGLDAGTTFNPGPVTNGNYEVQAGYVFIPVQKLQRLEMPLLAFWEPLRSLRLYSGLSVDYTLNGQAATENYFSNTFVNLDSDFSRKSANRLATNALDRWQWNYQGGLGWRIGRHAEVSAYWRAPLPNISTKLGNLEADGLFDPAMNTGSNSESPRTGLFVLQGSWFF